MRRRQHTDPSAVHIDRIIGPGELADILGVSRSTIWRMRDSGQLPPPVRVTERSRGWKASQVADFIESLVP